MILYYYIILLCCCSIFHILFYIFATGFFHKCSPRICLNVTGHITCRRHAQGPASLVLSIYVEVYLSSSEGSSCHTSVPCTSNSRHSRPRSAHPSVEIGKHQLNNVIRQLYADIRWSASFNYCFWSVVPLCSIIQCDVV